MVYRMEPSKTAGTPATTEDKYSIETKALTFNATTFATAGKVVCYYLLEGTHNTFTVDNVSFMVILFMPIVLSVEQIRLTHLYSINY